MKKVMLMFTFACLCTAAVAQSTPQQTQKIGDTTMKARNAPRHRHTDKDEVKKADTTKPGKEKNQGNVPTPGK